MSKNEILDRLFAMYDSMNGGDRLPTGLTALIMDLGDELGRSSEYRQRDEGERFPDFVRR